MDVEIEGGVLGSPLQAAAWRGDENLVQELLQIGSDVNDAGPENTRPEDSEMEGVNARSALSTTTDIQFPANAPRCFPEKVNRITFDRNWSHRRQDLSLQYCAPWLQRFFLPFWEQDTSRLEFLLIQTQRIKKTPNLELMLKRPTDNIVTSYLDVKKGKWRRVYTRVKKFHCFT